MKNMTPTPWKARKFTHFAASITGKDINNDICEMARDMNKIGQNANAAAIVSAVNNTYGKGINPEAVPDMLIALTELADQFESVRPKYSKDIERLNKARAAIAKASLVCLTILLFLSSCSKTKPVPDIRSGNHGWPPSSFVKPKV